MKKYIYLLISIIWMGIIFYFSHQSGDISGGQSSELLIKLGLLTKKDILLQTEKAVMLQFIIRKLAHMTVYFILNILFIQTFKNFKIKNYCILSWLMTTVYAISDELHQAFIPERGPSIRDVFIDSFGALMGLAIYLIMFNLVNKIRNEYN